MQRLTLWGWMVTVEDESGVPIAEVSRRLGVPMPTLRSWESRYGVPASSRTPGRHRRYEPAELLALKLMRDEIARGTRAGMAARYVHATLGKSGLDADFVEGILDASMRGDPTAVRDRLEAASGELGLGSCLDDVLFPALRQVGLWWQTGRCDVDQERLTTEAARAWLDRALSYAPAPTHPRPIVLACGPGDLHTVGLEALSLSLRHRRWGCRLLGARTTPVALTTAVLANQAVGAVVVSHLASGRLRAVGAVQAVTDLGVPTFYAGNAFATPRSRARVPGVYLGPRVQEACDLIVETLEAQWDPCC